MADCRMMEIYKYKLPGHPNRTRDCLLDRLKHKRQLSTKCLDIQTFKKHFHIKNLKKKRYMYVYNSVTRP